jgi:hypothetical protein
MVWIGLISYSLYLWHWPLIAFMRLIWGGEQSFLVYLLLFITMFPIAWLSWRFVERPFRRKTRVFVRSRLFAAAGIGAFAFLGIAISVTAHDGLPSRFSPAALKIADSANDGNVLGHRACGSPDIMAGQVCIIGATEAPFTFALVGDSFADALTPAVETAANQAGQRGYAFSRGGCYALIGINSLPACKEFMDAVVARIKSTPTIKTLILISRWTSAAEGTRFGALTYKGLFITDAQSRERSYAENKAALIRGLERDARAFEGYKVFVVAFVPEQLTYVPEAAALRIQMGLNDMGTPRRIVEKRQASVKEILDNMAPSIGFTVLDAMLPLCDEHFCRAIEDGRSLYADDNHLSVFGAKKEAELLAAAFLGPK